MVDPQKVLRFLDFTAIPTGGWDPSVAFVMGGGLVVMFLAVQYGKRIGKSASFSLGAAFSSGEASVGAGFGFDL